MVADRFVVYIAADFDLACGRGKGVADRHDEGARISDKVLHGRWNLVGFALRWGRSDSAFGDVVELASSGVGRGFGRGVSHAITRPRPQPATAVSEVEEPIKPFVGRCWNVIIGAYVYT